LLVLLLLPAGCVLGPNYQAPVSQFDPQWHGSTALADADSAVSTVAWWRSFGDPLLTDLIDQAMQNNRDLAGALANIESADALNTVAGAARLPTLDAEAGASRSRYSRQTGFGANTGMRNAFSGGLNASWELDLFGRTRRAIEVASAQHQVSQAVMDGMRLAIVAEIASSYFELRGQQRELAVARRSINLLREVEEISAVLVEAGQIARLAQLQAQGERESMAALLPALESEITNRIYRISVLTGKSPEFYLPILAQSEPMAMPSDRLPIGLRSEILQRRPDLRQAERELAAATANIGIVMADLYPSFSLTGAVGSSARVFSDLLTPATLTGSLGALLGWPLFHGGELTARVDVAKAETKTALAHYEQAVLLALEDAESALMGYGKAWQTLKLLQAAETTRQQAYMIAKLRFDAGEEGVLVVLDAERALNTVRIDRIKSETAILTRLTLLYKALGGGWQQPDQPT